MLLKTSTFNENKLKELTDFFSTDVNDLNRVKSEVILWNRYWDDFYAYQRSTIEINNLCDPDLFLYVFKLLQISITFSLSLVEVKRLFSTFKRINTLFIKHNIRFTT